MKKTIRLLLIVVLIGTIALSSVLFASCNRGGGSANDYVSDGETDISIGVLADIHVMSERQAVDMTCNDFKAWEAHGQKMLGLSESILKTAVDRIIEESDFDVVLVSGDNADDGGEVTHRAVAAELARLEAAGIKVFTIPGNHDINNKSYTYVNHESELTNPTTEKEFAEIYAAFGYNATDSIEFYKGANASAEDRANATFEIGDNLSYVADLSDKYRLIAIDMCNITSTYYLSGEEGYPVDEEGYSLVDGERYPLVASRHDGAMTADLLAWAKSKIRETIEAGKIPLGMMHFPLLQHFGALVQAENGAVNEPNKNGSVAAVLADAGMRFIFTGHIHIQDDNLYTSAAGNKILDVNSASLCNYPTPIRIFRAKGDEAIVRTWHMNYVKEEYLPSYLSAEDRSRVTSDLCAYSVDYLDGSMLAKIKNKVDMDLIYKLLSKLGVKKDGSNDAAVTALATELYNAVFLRFLSLPLYKKDAESGALSVEAAAEAYGKSLPASDYTTVFNLAMSFAAGLYGGDETCAEDDSRVTLLKYSIYTAFKLIDDFDFFARVKAIVPTFADIDLIDSLPELFKYGRLEICKNNLLVGLLSSLDIKALKKYLNITANTNGVSLLNSILSLIPALGVQDMLFGLDLVDYISTSESQGIGYVWLGTLIDDCFVSALTVGLTNDNYTDGNTYSYRGGVTDGAVPDNDVSVNMKTMAYQSLK